MNLFTFFYNSALLIVSLLLLPKILYERIIHGKYKGFLSKKLGRSFSEIKKGEAPLVWLHAVSLGETKAIWKFAELLKHRHPQIEILITSTTETGHLEAKRSLPFAKYHLYLPFDFPWIIRPIVSKIKPDLVILSETDYWYNFLKSAKENGAKTAIINAKLSERSLNRYLWLGKYLKTYFAPLDLICSQNSLYQERFSKLGIPDEKITITGNLKFDAAAEALSHEDAAYLRQKLRINIEETVLVAGSTHQAEEALILKCFQALVLDHPHLKLIIVPRHPERFSEVANLIHDSKLAYSTYSRIEEAKGNEQVLLIDAMGLLKKCYQLADIAIVCGSFVSHVGGHNILEPSFYGVPVLFGPYMHTQTELADLSLNAGASIQTNAGNLTQDLIEILDSRQKTEKLSRAGKSLTSTLQGTSMLTLDVIEKKFRSEKLFNC